LPRFIARIGFVDHIDLATTTHDLAVRVTLLGGFDRRYDFHKRYKKRDTPPPLSMQMP